MFRSVREVLGNVIKHARAQTISVTIKRELGDLAVSVTDNGIGFDAASVQEQGTGFGLLSIQESLERLGGGGWRSKGRNLPVVRSH